jgi:drug/metabolite transporter (DMT)-like permease
MVVRRPNTTGFRAWDSQPKAFGFLAAIVSAVTFGCLGLFSHLLFAEGFDVISSLALRFSISAVVLSLSIRFIVPQESRPSLGQRIGNMGMGAIGYGVSAGLFFYAMKHTSTGLANILLFQNPTVVFILTMSFRKVLPQKHQIFVLLATVAGLVLVCWPTVGVRDPLGMAAGIGSAIWYGGYLYLSESRSRLFHPAWMTLDVLAGSAIAFVAIGAVSGSLMWPTTGMAYAAVFAQSIFCTLIPVLSLLLAVRTLGARDATLVSSIEPAVALVMGALFLNESFTPLQSMGVVFFIFAVLTLYLCSFVQKKRLNYLNLNRLESL